MNTILGEIGKTQKFIDLNNQIENKKSPIQILGLTDVGMLQIIGGINEFDKKPICIITYNEIQAKKIYEDIKYFTDKVVLFPKKEIVTYDYIAESKDLPYERIETLDKIISKKNLIVVTTIEAVIQNIPTKETLYKNEIEFKVGETHNLEEIKSAFEVARNIKNKPVCIIANTIKGKGVSYMENKPEWHGKAPNDEEYKQAVEDIKKMN